MTDIDKARAALFEAATDYAYVINHDTDRVRNMEAEANLEIAARNFAKQWEKEMRGFRAAGRAAANAANGEIETYLAVHRQAMRKPKLRVR